MFLFSFDTQFEFHKKQHLILCSLHLIWMSWMHWSIVYVYLATHLATAAAVAAAADSDTTIAVIWKLSFQLMRFGETCLHVANFYNSQQLAFIISHDPKTNCHQSSTLLQQNKIKTPKSAVRSEVKESVITTYRAELLMHWKCQNVSRGKKFIGTL